MKRRFTILTAALVLLAFMTQPMKVMASDIVVTLDNIGVNLGSTANTTELTTNITATGTEDVYTLNYYQCKKQGNAMLMTKSVSPYISNHTAMPGNIKSVEVFINSGASGKTTYNCAFSTTECHTAVSGIGAVNITGGNSHVFSNLIDGTINVEGQYFCITLGNANNGQVLKLVITCEESGGTPSPSLSVSPNSIDFGSNAINPENPYTETFNVTFANLTENLTVTGFSGVTVSPATINANATSPQTVTVSYNPTTAGSISGNISVNSSEVDEQLVAVSGSAYDPANVDTYEKYTGALVEGDYIICANAEVAMKNVISGSRFENETVTVTDNKITNPDASIIWHVAPEGDYFTMYNAAVGKYAAGTTSNNQGTLIDDITDYAKWDITYQYSNYTVICYGRNSSSNKYLRRNGDYGWATYANSTGQVPTFYKKVGANQVATPTFSPVEGTYFETQSITLSCTTDGATIYYTTDGTTPSASNGTAYTTAISVSTTTTIKAIAIATGMTDSDVATATYTIEQPYSTIPALFEAATNTEQDVRVTFNNWVVSGVSTNGRNVYVTDNNGNGFIIYFTSDMSGTFAAGNILSGTAVACKLKLYNGAAELVNLTVTDLTITSGGTVSISNIPMSDLSGVNTGALVSYNNLTCSVSDNKYNLTDGTTTLQVYNTLYAFNEFEDGKTYNVTGVYVQYNRIKEIAPRSTADIEEVEVQHEQFTLTVGNLVHVTTYVFDASDQSEALLVGAGQVDIYDGTEVMISLDVEEGYVIESLIVGGVDVTSQIDADAYTFTMPTNAVTVTATAVEYVAPTPGNYVRINSLDQLTDGSKVIIAARHNATADSYYAMQNATSDKPEGTLFTSVTSGNDEAVASTITDDEDNYYWTVNVTENCYTFTNANEQMIGYSSSTNFATGNNTEWTIESGEAGNNTMVPGYEGFVIKNGTTTTRAFAFNGSAFGAYATTNMNAAGYNFFLDFFVQTSAPVTETYTLEIAGYGNSDGGYYLIASPVTVDPATVTNAENTVSMVLTDTDAANYDLFYFDQAKDKEWINYKGDESTNNPGGFSLVPGKGYLYAHKTGGNFILTGEPYSGTGTIDLVYDDNAVDFKGWNLVGNPWGVKAYPNHAFYTMAEGGASIDVTPNVAGTEVAPMTGIFVVAEGENETVTFATNTGNKSANLALNLTNSNKLVDRAIVRFGEGRQLPKFQINPNHTKIYMPLDGKDYAIVNAEEMGEMPVSFKAENNDSYTLSVNAEEVSFAYLHLIDNMTGNDVDLLQTPSYSFEAKTTDYESRFKLVFATGDNSNDDNFAFYSNGSFVINNEGNAELQVIDIMGRIVKSESINGCANVSVNGAAGVYMLRLVNGDNVKVQKVVVK